MNTRFQAISSLSKVKMSEEDLHYAQAYLQALSESPQNQQAFFEYCKKWKVAPWLRLQMEKHELWDYLNPETQTLFADYHQKIKNQNEKRNAEAARFLGEFEKAGIDAAILKGNLLIHTTYLDAGYKKMNDFDMLIHKEDWGDIQDIYQDLNYIPLGFGWSGEKEEPAKFSHVGLSFISPNYHCITGTQWGLKSPTSKYDLDLEDVWETATEFDFYGVKMRQLAPEYNLLHLILHMGVYKCGIRDCMDVYNLMQTFPEIEEDRLVEVIERSNAQEKAHFTLQLSQICSGIIPESLLKKLKPVSKAYLTQRLEKRVDLHEKTGDMQKAYHDYFQEIEMTLFRFNLFPKFHHRLGAFFKLQQQLFWPRKHIMLRLSDLDENASGWQKLLARFRAPYLVLSLIAEEIGWGITMLLFVKLFFDLIFSVKNYIIKQPSYFEMLESRGINPQEIIHVVKNIE